MRPLLLVHGFASSFDRSWRQPGWADLIEESGRDVVGIDLLGHGGAPRPHEPSAYADMGRDVANALPEGQVDGIGFSLGARLLLEVAIESPQRFGKLVVAGVGENVMRDEDHRATANAIEHGADEPTDNVSRAFARFAAAPGNDPLALAACLRRPSKPLKAVSLARVAVPVLVVIGDEDFAGPAQPLVEALPDARLVTLRGVDHLATANNYGFIDASLRFLDEP